MAYRAGCQTCEDYNDVSTDREAEQWEAAHLASNPGHGVEYEWYPSISQPWTSESWTPRPGTD